MADCRLSNLSCKKFFQETALEIYGIPSFVMGVHLIAAVVLKQPKLRPTLLGGAHVLSGYCLAILNHALSRDEAAAHHSSRFGKLAMINFMISLSLGKLLKVRSYEYWSAGSIATMFYISHYYQSRVRPR